MNNRFLSNQKALGILSLSLMIFLQACGSGSGSGPGSGPKAKGHRNKAAIQTLDGCEEITFKDANSLRAFIGDESFQDLKNDCMGENTDCLKAIEASLLKKMKIAHPNTLIKLVADLKLETQKDTNL